MMRVAGRHIAVDPDRARGPDPRPQRFLERAQATLSVPKVGSTLTRRLAAVNMK